jgi:AcrR family transcriptional regulator
MQAALSATIDELVSRGTMARPLSATDDEILQSAQQVMHRRGFEGFSLSEVAREVGLTRTAIALRFKSTDELKRTLIKRSMADFEARLADLELQQGAASLLAIADRIAEMAGSQDKFSGYMLRFSSNIKDPVLLEVEERRGMILRRAITAAMPETAIDRQAAADVFMAHLTGSLFNWQTSDEASARHFIRKRVMNWLRLAGIPCESAE